MDICVNEMVAQHLAVLLLLFRRALVVLRSKQVVSRRNVSGASSSILSTSSHVESLEHLDSRHR